MFRQINVELAKKGWNKKELADKISMNYSTFIGKMNGKYPFTLDECFSVKHALGSTLSLDQLFERS